MTNIACQHRVRWSDAWPGARRSATAGKLSVNLLSEDTREDANGADTSWIERSYSRRAWSFPVGAFPSGDSGGSTRRAERIRAHAMRCAMAVTRRPCGVLGQRSKETLLKRLVEGNLKELGDFGWFSANKLSDAHES